MNKPLPDSKPQPESVPYPSKALSYFDASPPPHSPTEFEDMLKVIPSAEGDDSSIVRSED